MIIASIALLLQAPTQEAPMTDEALLAYARTPLNYWDVSKRHVVIGSHNGVRVIARITCSDLCPEYSTRVIYYDVPPGPACDLVHGATRLIYVPYSISMRQEPFCVPRVLASQLGHPLAAAQYFAVMKRDAKSTLAAPKRRLRAPS